MFAKTNLKTWEITQLQQASEGGVLYETRSNNSIIAGFGKLFCYGIL